MSTSFTITCPKCQHQFNAEEMFNHHLASQLRLKSQSLEKDYQDKEAKLRKYQSDLKQKAMEIEATLEKKMQEREKILKLELSKTIAQEKDFELQTLKKELDEKQKMVLQAKQLEIELARAERTNQEMGYELELKFEQKLTAEKTKLEKELGERINGQYELKIAERDKKMHDLQKQLAEAQRKAEQGSIQLQGEVQELAIEDYLKRSFPIDETEEVKKGTNGADCIHRIKNARNQIVGSILYESKRTRSFQNGWIEKVKQDQLEACADIAVIVTETMPGQEKNLCQMDGVWICDFNTFKWLAKVLREKVVEIKAAQLAHHDKGNKMTIIYDYFTGSEFKLQVESIIRCFMDLKVGIEKQKLAYLRHVKTQEKLIEQVLGNTVDMCGTVKAIAGGIIALDNIELLQMNEGPSEEE